MINNAIPPADSQSSFIGTPRRGRGERAPRGERSRSVSSSRGRKNGVQRQLLDIQVTQPIEPTTASHTHLTRPTNSTVEVTTVQIPT